ncbi:MAG: Maf family protein [Synergistaceae bacterium]|jgi:septum formation protein|nr:Maf family protein [Synergistaceae bacterium]
MNQFRLILASESPRRKEIIRGLGWEFEAVSPGIEEEAVDGESPRDMAARLSWLKAASASRKIQGACVIGADTVVDVDGTSMSKPRDRGDSVRMLRMLAGRVHLVHTGVALAVSGDVVSSCVETTKVTFGELSEDEILSFAASGDGDDKAGAYAIQGRGALLVEKIDGCWHNVVGLPVFRLKRMLDGFAKDFNVSSPPWTTGVGAKNTGSMPEGQYIEGGGSYAAT